MQPQWLILAVVVVGLVLVAWLLRTARCLLRLVVLLVLAAVVVFVLYRLGVLTGLMSGILP